MSFESPFLFYKSRDLTLRTLSSVVLTSSCTQFLTGCTKRCRLKLVIDKGGIFRPCFGQKEVSEVYFDDPILSLSV